MTGTPFEVQALKDVSLDVSDGEFVGIIGHTGCGKSTLIQLMAGLLKPASGTVLVNGRDINASGYDRKLLRRTLGVVFQYPEYQLFEETVGKDVAFGPLKAGMTEAEAEKNVDTALELVVDLSPQRLNRFRRSTCPAGKSARWRSRACLPWTRRS